MCAINILFFSWYVEIANHVYVVNVCCKAHMMILKWK